MTVMDKLTILTDAAKYDAACTSSGARLEPQWFQCHLRRRGSCWVIS